jgi:hypothetical protein
LSRFWSPASATTPNSAVIDGMPLLIFSLLRIPGQCRNVSHLSSPQSEDVRFDLLLKKAIAA